MSFGFGVGDFITVIGLANKLRKDFSNAPKQYQAISSELKNCSLILQEIDVYLEGHNVSSSQVADLRQTVANSDEVLKNLEKVLTKYTKLETRGNGLRGRAQRIWQRVTWEPEDIRDFRSQLNANVIQLNALADGFNRQNVTNLAHSVTRLVERQAEKANQEILDWLAPLDHVSQHTDHSRQRLPDTGQWFISSPEYKKWTSNEDGTKSLVLSGIPGAGKTVLSSIIIDNLQESCSKRMNMRLCYYYCDYNRLENQQLDTVLLCLLRQLVQATAVLPDTIRELYDTFHNNSTRPPLASIKDVFLNIASSVQKVYVVIDALDECQTTNGFRRALLIGLLELSKVTNINLLVTSRPLPDILNTLKNFICIEIRASNTDITKYVEANIPSLPAFVGRESKLQDEIKAAVIEASDGIFLLATFYTRSLAGSRSPRHLRKAMESFGHGTSSYYEAYTKTMARIHGQAQEQNELAIEALMWIVHAECLLTCEELLHALATDPEDSAFYEDNIPDIEDVLSACCGLLILEEKTSLIRLVHRTAQEFFKEDGRSWLPGAQTRLSKVCNAYLNFVGSVAHQGLSDEAFKGVLVQFPLYNYATMHWSHHAELRETPTTLQELLAQQQQVDASSETFLEYLIPRYLELCRSTPGVTGLHLLAYHGLVELLPSFLERYDVNMTDKFGKTALSYAVQGDQEDAVSLLIDKGARLDIFDNDRLCPIWLAMRGSRNRIVEIILNSNSELLPVDHQGQSLLYYAAQHNNWEAVQLLLDRGCDPYCTDKTGTSLLHIAVNKRSKDGVKILLDKMPEPVAVDGLGRSPLHYAAQQYGLGVVQLLLDRGYDPCCLDKDGCSPLIYAIGESLSEEIPTLLIDKGADILCANKQGRTPLSFAAGGRNEGIQRFFLKLASKKLDSNTMRLQVSSKDKIGLTPFMYAARAGHHWILEFLMENGAGIDDCDNRKRTALMHAIEARQKMTTFWLLDCGANFNLADNLDQTTLIYAAIFGEADIIRALIDRGADINSVDSIGRNSLYHALRNSSWEIFDCLLELGIDPVAKDIFGHGILEWACKGQDPSLEGMAKCLEIQKRSSLETLTLDTFSVLHLTCQNSNFETLKLLINAGIKVTTLSTMEPLAIWTPLDIAIYWGNEQLVTTDGDLRTDLPWMDLLPSGIVVTGNSPTEFRAFRRNNFPPGLEAKGAICNYCLMSPRGLYFRCLHCPEKDSGRWDLCHLCKLTSEKLHPGHEWKPIESGSDDDDVQ